MCVEHNQKVEAFESIRFTKAMDKLSKNDCSIVEDNIENIIVTPLVGEQTKGDFSHVRVHKFNVNKRQASLNYTYVDQSHKVYLLSLGFCLNKSS